jgi:DNA mismatch repair protein MutL
MGIIKVLSTATARLIAAGEVIDRPASALRELLDNAIDAGAKEISVRIEEGGIGLIRVVDDGAGMDAEDVELSVVPHATSKISSADDLLRAKSLGFRGEALASIAAAARLEIVSRDAGSASAHRLVAGPGEAPRAEAIAGRQGTSVSVSGLFRDFPARRQFLKRPQAEAALCRQILTDKAVAHPSILFRLESGSGGSAETLMPADREVRVADCYPEPPRSLLHRLVFSGSGFEGEAVIAGPSFYRADRRLMQVFVNRRRVQEWSFLQALDYAFEGFLPGGAHPCAFLFLEVDPALADFNIHPAKREVRLKDPDGPRRSLIQAVRDFLGELAHRDPAQLTPDVQAELELHPVTAPSGSWGGSPTTAARGIARFPSTGTAGWTGTEELRERAAPLPPPSSALPFRYLGRALGPFLLFEMDDSLYFLDQHAAHERMLFDRLSARAPQSQELLVPLPVEAQSDEEERRIEAMAAELARAGFRTEREAGRLVVTAAPALLAEDPVEALRELARGSGEDDPLRAVNALAACRAAVKDGDELDETTATELIAAALALPEPRCPHGRPIWTRVTREQLFKLVRRIV